MICSSGLFFFFNDTATTEIYTLSLHDALPICERPVDGRHEPVESGCLVEVGQDAEDPRPVGQRPQRSEEHTSELQSRQYLVCRLLLEKKKPDASKDRI